MNTIFRIKDKSGENTYHEVEKIGQETCSIALKSFKGKAVIIHAFFNPLTKEVVPIIFK